MSNSSANELAAGIFGPNAVGRREIDQYVHKSEDLQQPTDDSPRHGWTSAGFRRFGARLPANSSRSTFGGTTPMHIDQHTLAEQLFNLLPEDGSNTGNGALLRTLQANAEPQGLTVTENTFQAARQHLLDAGRVVKGKGRGGSTGRNVESSRVESSRVESSRVESSRVESSREKI